MPVTVRESFAAGSALAECGRASRAARTSAGKKAVAAGVLGRRISELREIGASFDRFLIRRPEHRQMRPRLPCDLRERAVLLREPRRYTVHEARNAFAKRE